VDLGRNDRQLVGAGRESGDVVNVWSISHQHHLRRAVWGWGAISEGRSRGNLMNLRRRPDDGGHLVPESFREASGQMIGDLALVVVGSLTEQHVAARLVHSDVVVAERFDGGTELDVRDPPTPDVDGPEKCDVDGHAVGAAHRSGDDAFGLEMIAVSHRCMLGDGCDGLASSRPTSLARPPRTTVERVSFNLREQDPDAARFNAIAQSVLFALIGCIVGFVAAGLLVGTSNPVGWLIIGTGTAAGVIPIVRWARDRHADQLELFDIDRSLRPLLLRAAAAADRIERTATTAHGGPVSDLLDDNHRSALAHVKLLEHDARSGGLARKPELLQSCQQLDDLADVSERLLQTALRSQPTVLDALIERTALVNDALGKQALDPPIELSDDGGHVDRDATNDR